MSHAKSSLLIAVLFVNAVVSPSASAGKAPLEQLAWLAGCWNSEHGEPGSGEHWMPLVGNTLLGISRTIRGGNTVAYEFMRVANAPDGTLAFFAQPSGKAPASFPLLTLTATKVIFENLEHEFPQRVIYRLESPAKLFASIEGKSNGVNKSIEYPMVRVSCDLSPKVPPTQ
jgi:hypothetical protein